MSGETMSYLFANGSASPLQVNLIALLRDALDLMVALLRSEEEILAEDDLRREVVYTSEADLAGLRRLEIAMARTASEAAPVPETPTSHCAARIVAAAGAEVVREIAAVKQALAGELARLDARVATDARARHDALARFFCRHDLPRARLTLAFDWRAAAPTGELRSEVGGVEAVLDLDLPSSHLFAHPFRVERLAPGLEIRPEEASGWIRKDPRLIRERLDRYFLSEGRLAPDSASLRLRSSAEGAGPGFDLTVDRVARTVHAAPIGTEKCALAPSEPLDEVDARSVMVLHDMVAEEAADLAPCRRAVRALHLDGESFAERPRPRVLVERLVALIAPHAQELARHSPPEELVMKRVLAGDRREEIFVSRSALSEKLEALPPETRELFAPLALTPGGTYARAITLRDEDVVMIDDDDEQAEAGPAAPEPRRRAESPVIIVVRE